MSNYCIVRVEKRKNRGQIVGMVQHNFRERVVANADPARTHLNRTFGAQSTAELLERLDARVEAASTVRKLKPDHVPMLEYVITASPAWMAEQGPAGVERFFDETERWLIAKHGAENVLAITRQYDETTPHISAFVVPIGPKGSLTAAHFVDGPVKMAKLQSDFADQVGVPLGLERGIAGSKAIHQDVKRFYSLVNQPTPAMPPPAGPVDGPTIFERGIEAVGGSTKHSAAVERAVALNKQRAAVGRKINEVNAAKAKQLEVERGHNLAREATLRASKVARSIPLIDVMKRLGCTQDPDDKRNWHTPAGRISLANVAKLGPTVTAKFFNQDSETGGGGAIDLVMHIEGLDFKEAQRWLLQSFGGEAVISDRVAAAAADVAQLVAEPTPPYEAPTSTPSTWPRVRGYLVDVRRLAARLVDELYAIGRIYSDVHSNAVFELTSTDGDVVGVELRGTGQSVFKGVRGKKGVFDLAAAGADLRVAFVESSIEAMSLRELGFAGRIIGFAGSAPVGLMEIYAGELVKHGYKPMAAFNADKAGDAMAAKMVGAVAGVERLRPRLKDWNLELVAAREVAATPPAGPVDLPPSQEPEEPAAPFPGASS